jgi:hypothetical protein
VRWAFANVGGALEWRRTKPLRSGATASFNESFEFEYACGGAAALANEAVRFEVWEGGSCSASALVGLRDVATGPARLIFTICPVRGTRSLWVRRSP